MFDGFARRRFAVRSTTINAVVGGSGPPLLLLHGYPQSLAMWHELAPRLAETHTVVAADLRGYGDSPAPPDGDHSFRAMAADQVAVMAALGFAHFAVVGHDRGARTAHRMALDHAEVLDRVAVLDIVPTRYVLEHVDRRLASRYYHWFFLSQPADLPERLIAGDPIRYLHSALGGWGTGLDAYAPEALAEYERCFDATTIHSSCEDYRAALGVDQEHDEADRDRRVAAPVLVLWGANGVVGALHEPLEVWAEYAGDIRGQALDAGHFLVEERPAETVAALRDFLDLTREQALPPFPAG